MHRGQGKNYLAYLKRNNHEQNNITTPSRSNIEGLGQVNFGDSKEKLLKTWGQNDDVRDEHRLRFFKYGFFADFKKEDASFKAIEFWNDYDKSVSEVFIYGVEILQGDAKEIKLILQERNNNEEPKDGWFYNIDVTSGGSKKKCFIHY